MESQFNSVSDESEDGNEQTRLIGPGSAYGGTLPPKIGGYKILKRLGEGGMGSVLLAEDEDLQRRVAIKLIRQELLSNDRFRKRFLREARICAQLQHENIVQVYQISKMEDGTPFLVLEFIDGHTLRTRMRTPPPVPLAEVLELFIQCCDGLNAAALQGVIHRDIKPANIMITKRGTVKVMDFGLSKSVRADGLTKTNTVLGTPEYMAPEQADNENVDFRADVYSLGISLFQCTTGFLPFKASSVVTTVMMHARDPLPEAPMIDNVAGGKLRQLIEYMVAKEPQDRPNSFAEIKNALSEIVENLGDDSNQSILLPSGASDSKVQKPTPNKRPGSSAKRTSSVEAEVSRHSLPMLLLIVGALVLAGVFAGAYFAQAFSNSNQSVVAESDPSLDLPTPELNDPEPFEGTGFRIKSDGSLTTVGDLIAVLGTQGVNWRVVETVRQDYPAAYSFRFMSPPQVLTTVVTALGWDVEVDEDGTYRIGLTDQEIPVEQRLETPRGENALPSAADRNVSLQTANRSITVYDACLGFQSRANIDFIIFDRIAQERIPPTIALTSAPLKNALGIMQETMEQSATSANFGWGFIDNTLVIYPRAPQ